MKKEIADIWIKELRSGNFAQGKFYLCQNNQYCCLGVLCEIANRENICKKTDEGNYKFSYNSCTGFLPFSVMKWAGIKTEEGSINKINLAVLNDSENYSFDQIAAYIEQNYEAL